MPVVVVSVVLALVALAASQQHLDEVHEQGGLEHPVQPHVAVGQQVCQTSSRTVFNRQSKDPRVQKQTQVQVQVLVSHLPQLDSTDRKYKI